MFFLHESDKMINFATYFKIIKWRENEYFYAKSLVVWINFCNFAVKLR